MSLRTCDRVFLRQLKVVMADRQTALTQLTIGDIFLAEHPSGASLICLVTSITPTIIRARRVTTQDDVEFDRITGMERLAGGASGRVRIDSIAPLPTEIREVILGLDRKYGQKPPPDLED